MRKVSVVIAVAAFCIVSAWSVAPSGFTKQAAAAPGSTTIQDALVVPGDDMPVPSGLQRDGGLTGHVTSSDGNSTSTQVVWAFGDTLGNGGGLSNTYATGVPTLDHQNNDLNSNGYPKAALIDCPVLTPAVEGHSLRCWPSGFANQPDGSTIAYADLVEVYSTTENGESTTHMDSQGVMAYRYSGGTQTPAGSPVQIFDENDCGWSKPFQGPENGVVYTYLTAHPTNGRSDCPSPETTEGVLFTRVPVGQELNRGAYQFYDAASATWSSDEISASSSWSPTSNFNVYGSVAWNPYLNRYLAIIGGCAVIGYESVCGNQISYTTAPTIGDLGTEASTVLQTLPGCDPERPKGCGYGNYVFAQHPVLQAEDGRFIEISYYSSETDRIKTETVILNPDASTASDLVSNLYTDVTGLQIDASLEAELISALEGGSSLSALKEQIEAEVPLASIYHFTSGLIYKVLGRVPVGTEVGDTFQKIASEGWNEAAAELYHSPDFIQSAHGNPNCPRSTDFECYIWSIYDVALDRDPSANEYKLFNAFADNGSSYEDFATAFIVGPSGVADQAHQHQVFEAYADVYGRQPTTDELQTGGNLLEVLPSNAPPLIHGHMYNTAQGVAALLSPPQP